MTRSELKTIAKQLLEGSSSLREAASPDSTGFKAVGDWLYKRESALFKKYGISRKDIYQLTFDVNSIGAVSDEELSLED